MCDLGWAAGFIDGDGSIMLARGTGGRRVLYTVPTIAVQVRDYEAVKELQNILGGQINCGPHNGKEYWTWRVTCQEAADVAAILRPFLVLKADQAWLIQEAWAQMQAQKATVSGRGYEKPEEVTALREGYALAVSGLNTKD